VAQVHGRRATARNEPADAALPNWKSHLGSCFYPDEWLLQIKAQRQAEVLAPIVENALVKQ